MGIWERILDVTMALCLMALVIYAVAIPFRVMYTLGLRKPRWAEGSGDYYFLVGGLSVVTLFAVMSVSSIGRSVTARLASAETETKIEKSFGIGQFVQMDPGELPKGGWFSPSPSEPLFVQATPSERGYRVVISAEHNTRELRRLLAGQPTITVVEVRWRYRYPARIFRWLGPVVDRTDVVRTPDGKEMVVEGLSWWTSLKS